MLIYDDYKIFFLSKIKLKKHIVKKTKESDVKYNLKPELFTFIV